MTEPALEANAAPPKRLSIRTRRIVWALLIACCVFAGFAVYAYTAPTTYLAQTDVVLQVPERLEGALYPIADRRQRLVKALSGPEATKQITRALGVTTPDARLELARSVANDVSITTTDGHEFQMKCRHSAAAQAQQLCQGLGRIAAANLPDTSYRKDVAAERERTKKFEELLAFLVQHPELSDTRGQQTAQDGQGKRADSLLNVLLYQRQVVLKELQELKHVSPGNPYADGLNQETRQAQMRLGAIDAAIAKRKAGLGNATEPANPELDSRALNQLTAHLNKLSEAEQPETPTGKLKAVASETKLPEVPITPNRARLLVLGALASLGVAIIGLGFALAARLPGRAPRKEDELPDDHLRPPQQMYAPPPEMVFQPAAAVGHAEPEPWFQPPLLEAKTPSPDERALVHNDEADASLDNHAIALVPRTRIGGFESSEPPKAPGRPISVRKMVAVEAHVVPPDAPGIEPPITGLPVIDSPVEEAAAVEEEAPRTLLGGTQPRAKEAPAGRAAYTPPARNITRRLGSLSWLDQADVTRAPAPAPVSTRYSYVSSRPPPPEGANQSDATRERDLIETVAEADPEQAEAPTEALSVRTRPHVPPGKRKDEWSQVRHHPLPVGWTLNPVLLPASSKEFADSVREQAGDECCVVGVTARPDLSPSKSRVAVSLGLQLGQSMRRVLLMEGDFQNPMIHRLLRVEMPMSGGFSAQLQRHLHARDSVRVWDVVQGSESIDILAEGLIRSPGAILSQQFEQSLEDLKHYYDIIVIDGPPLGSSSECRAFADMVDGVVVCTSRDRPDVQSGDGFFENKRFVIAHQMVGEA